MDSAFLGPQDRSPQGVAISMAFQPIVRLENGAIFGHEALVRGVNGEGARAVMSAIEQNARYMFDQQCRLKALELADQLGLAKDGAYLSINFMPNAAYDPRAGLRVTLEAAQEAGFPVDQIIFEFTEDEKFDVPHLLNVLLAYREMGFKTAIDDFGSGHSGLSLLSQFQPDIVKIDMSLIRGINADPVKRAIVKHMVNLLDERGITSLAEGVETPGELTTLQEIGVSLVQGFVIAKPTFEALSSRATVRERFLQAAA
jgi:EAL domain-containing protein (putative c-di-GMP-specific phosphodiesterase class I)